MLRPLLVLSLFTATAAPAAAVPTRWIRGTSLDRGHGGWFGDVTGAGQVVDGIVIGCAVVFGLVMLTFLVMWLKRDRPGVKSLRGRRRPTVDAGSYRSPSRELR